MQNNLSFTELTSGVLEQLKSQGYMDSTLIVYSRTFKRIHSFMRSANVTTYTEQVGEDFLQSTNVCKSTMVAYRCAVRRLNDFICGKPYICHTLAENDPIPESFQTVAKDYIRACENSGNKPLTIRSKRRACTRFLRFIEENGYTELVGVNTEIVSKSLSIYSNGDDYARLRLFLKYLYEIGIVKTDLSVIIPRYKRRKPIPTVYSPTEVQQIEESIDDSNDTGKRNLAIVRLASRMGLRSGDIAKLKWSEIDFVTGYITIIQEKTRVPLTLQMPDDVVDALTSHAKVNYHGSDNEYVFHQMVAPHNRISTAIVQHAVNNAIAASGIDYTGKKHGPHALRSSLASSMVNDGEEY